jgi:hemoglobin/transferrin/lactoferrin receptor protein
MAGQGLRHATGVGLAVGALIAGGLAARAQDAQVSPEGEIQLDPITVSAPVATDAIYESTNPESIVDRTEIETEIQPNRPSEVLDILPGVATVSQGGDPGTAINIRGLQDFGRVNVTIDGARQNFQTSGHSANGVFYIDPEMVKSVEVVRGAASATEGSGSIGGGVDFRTLDAGDVLDPGDVVGARLKTRYTSNGDGMMYHGEAAGRIGDAFDVIAAGTWSKIGDYYDGFGNPVLNTGDELLSGLAKARARPADGHELTLTALRYHDTFDAGVGTVRATTAESGTYSAGYKWAEPGDPMIDLSAKAYYTTTRTDQKEIVGLHVGARRWFEIGTAGIDLQNTSRFETGAVKHAVSVGIDGYRDAVETFDSRGLSNGLTPTGTRMAWGGFAQDKLRWGRWELTGALRYDGWDIQGGSSGGKISPKATLAFTPVSPLTLFATYAQAVRVPAVTESLVAGIHPAGPAFEFLPNPGLVPETAHEVDVGVNLRLDGLLQSDDKLRAKLVGYHNTVDDYIDGVYEDATKQHPDGTYQYRNIARAELWGAELEGMYDTGEVFLGIAGTLNRGINAKTGKALTSLPSDRIVTTLGMRPFADQRLVIGSRVSVFAEQEHRPDGFLPSPGYEVVDVFVSSNLGGDVLAVINIDNIFNRYYTQYQNTMASRGRTLKVSLAAKF